MKTIKQILLFIPISILYILYFIFIGATDLNKDLAAKSKPGYKCIDSESDLFGTTNYFQKGEHIPLFINPIIFFKRFKIYQ
jgi:hypothetical protein